MTDGNATETTAPPRKLLKNTVNARWNDQRSWDVTLAGYALDETTDRFTTLPLVLDLLRRRPDPALAVSHVHHDCDATTSSTWRFRLTATPDTDPRGLVRVSEVSTP